MKLRFIISLFFLFSIYLSAQTNDSLTTTENQTSPEAVKEQIKLKLSENPFYYDIYKTDFHPSFFILQRLSANYINEKMPLSLASSIQEEKSNISYALQMQYRWNTNSEKLGVIGTILYIANFAATGYLLYEHINRYGDEYKKDFGKKKK
ncbi:MAG: hypothetical protein GXO87_04045 [Chlorobi bacterium]|nr:hypothetical protein [Chlorobiota bacterium]